MPRIADSALVFTEVVLGIRPHRYQAEFLADNSPIRVMVAGRRSGKSTIIACELAFLAARAAARGEHFTALLTGPVTDQARIPLGVAERLLRASAMGGLITRSITSPFPHLELGRDVSIVVRPASECGRHLRGHAFSCAYVDEAGYVADAAITTAIMPTLADESGRLTLSSTPGARGSLLERLFIQGKNADDSRVRSFSFPTLANPHVDRAFVEQQQTELSHEQWATEWLGEWIDPVDSVFRWGDVLAAARGELGHGGEGARYVTGFDPAKTQDRSALVVLDVTNVPRRLAHLEDLHGQDYARQVERVASVAQSYGSCRVAVDATGGGAVVCDLLRAAGVWVEPVIFSAARKVDLVTGLIVAVQKGEIIFPAHPDLLSEFRWFRASRSPSGVPRYEASAQGHDDYIAALCLALAAGGGVARRVHPAHEGLPAFLTSSSPSHLGAFSIGSSGLPDLWEDIG